MQNEDKDRPNLNNIINKAAFNGILINLIPLTLPIGTAAFIAIYIAGKTFADVAFDCDKSKSLVENLSSKMHLPFYHALEYASLALMPFFTTPFASMTSGLYDCALLQTATKVFYFTSFDKYVSEPASKR